MECMQLSTSLIISTYNWPEALSLCLESVLHQTVLPDEVIIADDGSRDDTRRLIEAFRQRCPVPLLHVWHEDDGFRKTQIMNQAFLQVSHPYIIQIDGDIILNRHFVEDHLRFAREGSFVTGSRVVIGKELTQRLLRTHRWRFSLFTPGLHNRLNGLRLPFLTKSQENYRQHDTLYVRGCNMAFWRKDIFAVNGYDEAITGWGREDNELAERLINSGIRKRVIKFSAIAFHLYHEWRSRGSVERNDEILHSTMTQKRTRCERGIDGHT